jgi:hypothetical protein
MTEAKAPEFYFNGIEFNSQYFKDESDIIGFTQDESDARYLKKTITDTATALQTFSSGLNFSGEINGPTIVCTTMKTNTYQSKSINQPLTLGNNQISPDARMDIGCNVARTGNINIANTQTTGTADIVIGSSLLTTGSQNIQINRPLTIGYTVNPTSLTQIGGSAFINATAQSYGATPSTGSSKTLAVLNNIPIGIYQVFYNISTTITVATANFTERITTISDRVDDTALANVFNFMINSELQHQTRTVGHNFTITGGGVFVNTTANDSIFLNQRFIYTAGPTLTATGHLRIVRIG